MPHCPIPPPLSPGLVNDLPHTIQHHVSYIAGTVTPFFLAPLIGTYMYAADFVEKEKLHHRY